MLTLPAILIIKTVCDTGTTCRRSIRLIVENSYQGEVRTRGRHFLSSKRDAEGIGLSSVCDGVKRAGGTVKIHYDGKIFQVSVMVTGTQKF